MGRNSRGCAGGCAGRRVGVVGRILAVLCFMHCALFLALLGLTSASLITLPGRWLALFDNMWLHLTIGGFAVVLAWTHLLVDRAHMRPRAVGLVLFGSLCIAGSISGEALLHHDHHAHHVSGALHSHTAHDHGLPHGDDSSLHHEEVHHLASCGHDCTAHGAAGAAHHHHDRHNHQHHEHDHHDAAHLALHGLFMLGNVTLFAVHTVVLHGGRRKRMCTNGATAQAQEGDPLATRTAPPPPHLAATSEGVVT